MQPDIEKRAELMAEYIIEYKTTVRAAAAKFGISKSTVHKDLTERLSRRDRALWLRVREVLEKNKAERHIRGGEATRKKYRGDTLAQRKPPSGISPDSSAGLEKEILANRSVIEYTTENPQRKEHDYGSS